MSRPATKEATLRQQETLSWVKAFIRDHGMPPTVREIGRAFGIDSSSVFYLLKQLERKGYLERGDLGARSLIVKGSKPMPRNCTDVRVIGRIAAGRPIEAIEHYSKTLHVSSNVLRGHSGYVLKVVGDSMIDAGILDGDYVIVRKQDTAEDGDIIVALIGDEATLKRFYRERGGVRLEPANLRMKPIHVKSGDFKIQGRVVAIHREL